MLAGGVIVLISMGLRQSFGIFMQPLGCVLGIDRESFGLAIALQNLLRETTSVNHLKSGAV